MKNVLRRNMKLHFGTPASVLFSMVGVLITFFVCAVFLEDSLINQVMDRAPGMDRNLCKWLIECWIMAGLLSMTPVTASAVFSSRPVYSPRAASTLCAQLKPRSCSASAFSFAPIITPPMNKAPCPFGQRA